MITLLALLVAFTALWDALPDKRITYEVAWRDDEQKLFLNDYTPATGTVIVSAGTATRLWVPNPPAGVARYFAVRAVDWAGVKSKPSETGVFPSARIAFHGLSSKVKWRVEQTPDQIVFRMENSAMMHVEREGQWIPWLGPMKFTPESWGGIGPSAKVTCEIWVAANRPQGYFRLVPTQ